jgi:hypothetical protein
MDMIVIPCKKCGCPLSALPTMQSRKCAACGATTKVLAFQREQAVPIGEAAISFPLVHASKISQKEIFPDLAAIAFSFIIYKAQVFGNSNRINVQR